MSGNRDIRAYAADAKAAIGYGCICAWGVVLLLDPIFGSEVPVTPAPASMLPGLLTCLIFIFGFRRTPPIFGRSRFVTLAACLVAAGTLLCTLPATSALAATRVLGLVLSGMFALVLVMAWFDVYARLHPRTVIVLSGCAISVAALICWAILSCPDLPSSLLASLLPLLAWTLLPSAKRPADAPADADEGENGSGAHDLGEIMSAAVPARTLLGVGITFFIVSSIGALAPQFDQFSEATTPLSLLIAFGMSIFFIASARLVHHRIDTSILYKILLSIFAAVIFLLAYSVGISASLLLYANIIADVMMWTVVALWSKKTPVAPHLVFAIAWIAECLGNTLGQIVGTLFVGNTAAFGVIALMLILLAVGFAFSEGSLVVDVDFAEEPAGGAAADAGEGATEAEAQAEEEAPAEGPKAADAGDAEDAAVAMDDEEPAEEPADGRSQPAPSLEARMEAFEGAHGLSPRECEVFELWVTGHGLKHIEQALFISEATVKTHLRNIYRKCDVHSRADIIDLFEEEQPGAGR